MDAAKCYFCYGVSEEEAMELALLVQILNIFLINGH